MSDYPDWDPIPQLTVVTPASTVANNNQTSTVVDPGVNGAVRLWTAELILRQEDTAANCNCFLLSGSTGFILGLELGFKSGAGVSDLFDKVSQWFGGVVLPRGMKLQLQSSGTSCAATALVTYTLT